MKKGIVIPVLTPGLPLACSALPMSVSSMFSNRLMISYSSTVLAAQGAAGVFLPDKRLFYLPILYLMNHFFGMNSIAFPGAVILVFSLIAGIFFCLKWYRQMENFKL